MLHRTALLAAVVPLVLGACGDAGPAPAPTGSPTERAGSSVRVDYRVEDLLSAPPRVTTLVVETLAPYRARQRTTDSAGASLGGLVWTEESQVLLPPAGGLQTVATVPPAPAGPVSGLAHALPTALRLGVVARLGTDAVAGRTCVLYRSKAPLDAEALGPATARDVTDSCVDDTGLVLRETWTIGGQRVRVKTALRVGAGADLTGAGPFDGTSPPPAPEREVGEQVMTVGRDVLVRALGIDAPPPPPGFSPDRAAATIRRDEQGTVEAEGGVLAWRSGDRLVTLRLDRGLTRRLVPPSGPSAGAAVTLPGGRAARVQAVHAGVRLTFAGEGGLVATVTGDAPEELLARWAGALVLRPR